jgi:hypothetical protein
MEKRRGFPRRFFMRSSTAGTKQSAPRIESDFTAPAKNRRNFCIDDGRDHNRQRSNSRESTRAAFKRRVAHAATVHADRRDEETCGRFTMPQKNHITT